LLLMRVLIGFMMANDASCASPQSTVMAGKVSCHAADGRTLQAAGGLCR
jgi:hypothetical protein